MHGGEENFSINEFEWKYLSMKTSCRFTSMCRSDATNKFRCWVFSMSLLHNNKQVIRICTWSTTSPSQLLSFSHVCHLLLISRKLSGRRSTYNTPGNSRQVFYCSLRTLFQAFVPDLLECTRPCWVEGFFLLCIAMTCKGWSKPWWEMVYYQAQMVWAI